MAFKMDSEGPRHIHECEDCKPQKQVYDEMLEALKFIAEGRGAFSLDPLQHATNTINEMKEVARQVIAKAETL